MATTDPTLGGDAPQSRRNWTAWPLWLPLATGLAGAVGWWTAVASDPPLALAVQARRGILRLLPASVGWRSPQPPAAPALSPLAPFPAPGPPHGAGWLPRWAPGPSVALALVTATALLLRHVRRSTCPPSTPLAALAALGQKADYSLNTPPLPVKPETSFIGEPPDVLIVGAGPAGLACAFSLAGQGVERIAVVESGPDLETRDWARSYCYRIDGHGTKWLDAAGLREEFEKVACRNAELLTSFTPDGEITATISIARDVKQKTYWLPRSDLTKFLLQQLRQRHPSVSVHFAARLKKIEKNVGADGACELAVELEEALASGPVPIRLKPRFVIGADGVRSVVRQHLERWDPKFALQLVPHVTSGLLFKSLALKVDESLAPTGSFFIIRGKGKGKEAFGVFPQRADRIRFTGCVRQPGHPIWQVKDAEALYRVLEADWPQMDWRRALCLEAAEAFVGSPPVKFPVGSYSPHFQVTMKAPPHPTLGQEVGLLVLGDAIHCFCPDLGQGVNASLEDVFVFDSALRQARGSLGAAFPLFEAQRRADAEAVTRLLPIGAPYQYTLPFTLRKLFWYIDFTVRLLGSKLLPWAISEPVIFGLQDPANSYAALLAGHRRTTRALWAALLGTAVGAGALLRAGVVGAAAARWAVAAGLAAGAVAVAVSLRRGMTLGRAKQPAAAR